MPEGIKPIKRSKELAPLSREHHNGLLFVWKIREGLKLNVSLSKLRNYAIWSWQQRIKHHFFEEEKILMPFMPADHAMALRMKKEHDCIREFVLSIDHEAEAVAFAQLADLVEDHIRFEERELYPYLEQTLSADELQTIFKELEAHPISCEEWTDEFWVKAK